ncbi:MAG: acyl carrier protein [Bdellovibrionota bacterium]
MLQQSNIQAKIRATLLALGLSSVPDSPDENLADYGLDSLMMVLAVAQFEKEFSVKIPGDLVEEENFSTLAKLEAMLRQAGAK